MQRAAGRGRGRGRGGWGERGREWGRPGAGSRKHRGPQSKSSILEAGARSWAAWWQSYALSLYLDLSLPPSGVL